VSAVFCFNFAGKKFHHETDPYSLNSSAVRICDDSRVLFTDHCPKVSWRELSKLFSEHFKFQVKLCLICIMRVCIFNDNILVPNSFITLNL
jgi:hypothetical protein